MFDNRVIIQVSGMVFETHLSTLEKFPNTLLGSPVKRQMYYVQELNQYVFQRNRQAFHAILFFYQSDGKLHRPEDLPMKIFKEEVEFFELDRNVVLQMLEKNGYIEEPDIVLPTNRLQRKILELFEHPHTSNAAHILAIFSMTAITISVLIGIVQSFPSIEQEHYMFKVQLQDLWFVLDLVLNCWFAFELLVRFGVSPNKRMFVKSTRNIVDLIVVLPFFLVIAFDNPQGDLVPLLQVLRMFRILRMFKAFHYSRSLRIVIYCAIASLHELSLLVLCLSVMVVLTSSLLYYAETNSNKDTPFTSVPATFWYSIQTLTTVGYGDMVPVTPEGKLISAFGAILGVLTMTLPVLTFVSNFNNIYSNNMEMIMEKNRGMPRR